MSDQDIRLGRVTSVSGATVQGMVRANGMDEAPPPGVGNLVRIPTRTSTVFGLVSSLETTTPSVDADGDSETGIAEIQLVGEILGTDAGGDDIRFDRGVSVHPPLGADILAATGQDLGRVYARPAASNVRIGTIHQDRNQPAYVLTDDVLGKHFAVLGTTGAGKSCAVAMILRAVLEEYPFGHIVLLDPHNEYARCFGDKAEVLDAASLQLPYWMLNFEEAVEVMTRPDSDHGDAEAAILKAGILGAKKSYAGKDADTGHFTVDTPVPYRIGELVRVIEEGMGKLEKPEGAIPYLRLKARLEALQADQRFAFMFSGIFVSDNMTAVLSQVLRIPVEGKPLTIVDLSGTPSEIIDAVVSLLARMIFDFGLWCVRRKAMPLLLVCEEAHRYVPRGDSLKWGAAKKSIARIAREGRKYGVSLCLVSQRPSELDPDIVSQCNTMFALRMSNESDQVFVRGALPDYARALLDSLPSLRTQEAIAVGEGVMVPMRLRFDNLDADHRPDSATASFSTAWKVDEEGRAFLDDTIDLWRHQKRPPASSG
jgi:DNA helicase HerA-like ATPase